MAARAVPTLSYLGIVDDEARQAERILARTGRQVEPTLEELCDLVPEFAELLQEDEVARVTLARAPGHLSLLGRVSWALAVLAKARTNLEATVRRERKEAARAILAKPKPRARLGALLRWKGR